MRCPSLRPWLQSYFPVLLVGIAFVTTYGTNVIADVIEEMDKHRLGPVIQMTGKDLIWFAFGPSEPRQYDLVDLGDRSAGSWRFTRPEPKKSTNAEYEWAGTASKGDIVVLNNTMLCISNKPPLCFEFFEITSKAYPQCEFVIHSVDNDRLACLKLH